MATALNRGKIKNHLQDFTLQALFIEELGWDHGGEDLDVPVAGKTFSLPAIAQKRGMVVYQYRADSVDAFPDHPTRQKIERVVTKTVHEHLIIYATHDNDAQVWQWIKREPGQSDRSRQHIHHQNHSGEALIQKLEQLVFTLDEEADLTIVDVSGRVRAAFDVEKVTKRFYDRFKKEHGAFPSFIDGITAAADREWYASLMLNRMMFIYFIQKRGFLDGDVDYLRNRLRRLQAQHGRDRFQTFYRLFLLRLFHEGLSRPAAELANLLGRVPYLNGGLFEVHDLERDNPDIHIPDEAFSQIFDFFDAYQWHLDDRPLRNDNEINPDVLGYIFEKYVNQKQMGAYYTKEDITGYISRNTILPFLFDRAQKECAIAFKPGGGVWRLLPDEPDRYVYPAVRHGITYDIHKGKTLADKRELPQEIAAGLQDVSQRGGWNQTAPPDYALPTETWREHVARRQRYEEVHAKLAGGEVTSINDLITYNLDIETFAQDVMTGSEGPELVRAFWKAMSQVSVLDPTCGSGAFLFAALNILEPLYTACLEVMRGFLDDLERSQRKHGPERLRDFRKVLRQVDEHASERYFILKSIIIDNLYGVDIMEEAVEICKLRLFLKLVAELERYEQIEPLPDIDFNIRAGNTLVGFTTLKEIQDAFAATPEGQQRMLYAEDATKLRRIEEDAAIADRAFGKFRDMQTEHGMDAGEFTDAKRELRNRLNDLREELDRYLAGEYGVEADDERAYGQWRESHQPFHWFAEFYGIMCSGGFDVIIGNPPYLATSKVRKSYTLRSYDTQSCSDIYACVTERSEGLLRKDGRVGMIVPLSLGFSSDFDICRRLLLSRYRHNWFSSFGRIPSALFNFDVRVRNIVHLSHRGGGDANSATYTTRLHRWFEKARPVLFSTLEYVPFHPPLWKYRIPKLNSHPLASAFETALQRNKILQHVLSKKPTKHVLHYKQTAYNWLAFSPEVPPATLNGRPVPQTMTGSIYFLDATTHDLGMLIANGKLMLIFWLAVGDDFHVTRWNVEEFPFDFDRLSEETIKAIRREKHRLEKAMEAALQFKLNAGRRVGNYNLAKCRDVTDKVDILFAKSFGFEEVMEDIDLYYTQTIKTDFDL